MLFAGWEVRMVKNCDRGLENAARGRRPSAAFSRPRKKIKMLFTGFGSVRMVKNCDRGLENAFSSPRSQCFHHTDRPKAGK